jgi:hypothetical protein
MTASALRGGEDRMLSVPTQEQDRVQLCGICGKSLSQCFPPCKTGNQPETKYCDKCGWDFVKLAVPDQYRNAPGLYRDLTAWTDT